MSDLTYKLIQMTDGQQILVAESQSVKVTDIGIVSMEDAPPVSIDSSEDIVATPEQYDDLLTKAMTNTLEVDTITGKAQAIMNTEIPTEQQSETPIEMETK